MYEYTVVEYGPFPGVAEVYDVVDGTEIVTGADFEVNSQ